MALTLGIIAIIGACIAMAWIVRREADRQALDSLIAETKAKIDEAVRRKKCRADLRAELTFYVNRKLRLGL